MQRQNKSAQKLDRLSGLQKDFPLNSKNLYYTI